MPKQNANEMLRMTQSLFVWLMVGVAGVFANEDVKCPTNTFNLLPCRCLAGGPRGIDLYCAKSNLGTIALALNNVKVSINSMQIVDSNFARLYGPLFKGTTVHSLILTNCQTEDIDTESLGYLKNSLKELTLAQNKFHTVPESINNALANLTKLHITNTATIIELKASSLKKFTNLIELDLHNNSIKKMEPTTFASLAILERLNLSGNELSKLERNLFRANKKLSVLDLSHNQFKEFGKFDFNDLLAVTTLNLSFNQLKDLPRSIFSRVSQLRVLNLSGNRFKQIDSYMLRGVRFLKEFYATNNLIKELAKNAFTSTTRVKIIDLSYNELVEVETEIFKDMQWLDLVDLSHNKIIHIRKGSFQRMFKIAINLSHNNISSLEYKSFQALGNITELDLSHNQLSTVKSFVFEECDCTVFKLNHNLISNLSNIDIFANLTGLRMLNLSHNFITEINRKHFTTKKLYELDTIDLSYNNISELSGSVFEKFLSVRLINLTHNSLRKIAFNAFGNLPTLLHLDLSHNQIKEVANGGVSNLISVKEIYLNDNQLERMFPISVAVNTIHLQNNCIREIRPEIFPMINAVLAIYLDNNNISQLNGNTFVNCASLNTLSLRNNSISEVPQRALAPLTSLQNLDLSHNGLTKLDQYAFGSLRILFDLNLSFNQISTLSDYTFGGLLQLLHLNMSNNQIGQISTDVFNSMFSLRSLDLSHNSIAILENGTHSIFQPLLSLESLNLSHNRISLIKDRSFPHSPWIPYKLQRLDLSYNTIPVLTSHFDNGLAKLQWLSLRGNIINEIHPNTLGNITLLRRLDLSRNDLRKLNKGIFKPPLKYLEHLDLSTNKIATFVVNEFSEMAKLKLLNLSSNRLANIDQDLLPQIRKNLELHLNDNPLYCDCKVMPLVGWIHSKKLKAEQEGTTSLEYEHWSSVVCHEPAHLNGKHLVDIRAYMLDCSEEQISKYKSYFRSSTAVKIRRIQKFRQRRQDLVEIVWFIESQVKDIASFNVLFTGDNGEMLVNETVSYHKRYLTVNSLPINHKYVACVAPISSKGLKLSDSDKDCIRFFNGHSQIEYEDSAVEGRLKMTTSATTSSSSSHHLQSYLFCWLLFFIVNIL